MATTRKWGQTKTLWDNAVDLGDVNLAVAAFQGQPMSTNAKMGADVHGPTGCHPDGIVNLSDINSITQAFQGIPFTPNAGCPAITTCDEYVDPGNPYYFTGRRLDVLERDADGSITGHEAEPGRRAL